MSRPPTMEQASARGLVAKDTDGIHTFSNGTDWECWASGNCFACKHYDWDSVGPCAFEGYSQLGMVSPAMALLFGWTQNPKYADYQAPHDAVVGRHGWDSPDACRFFQRKDERDGDRYVPSTPTDPAQLVLIADPTEVIHGIQPEVRVEVTS